MRLRESRPRLAVTGLVFLLAAAFLPANAAAAPAVPDRQVASGGAVRTGAIEADKAAPFKPIGVPAAKKPEGEPPGSLAVRKGTWFYGPITMGPYEWWTGWVYCPDGMRASGGGGSNSSSGDVTMLESRALPAGNGWQVRFQNHSNGSPTFKVYAICWNDLDNYSIIETKTQVGPNLGIVAESGQCPRPAGVIGGGGYADTHNVRVLHSMNYALSWGFGIHNKDSVPRTVNAQVVCGRRYGWTHPGSSWAHIELAPGQYGTAFARCGSSIPLSYSGGGESDGATITDMYPEGDGFRIYVRNDTGRVARPFSVAVCGT